jgi:hypothetical protein
MDLPESDGVDREMEMASLWMMCSLNVGRTARKYVSALL